jgi:hypothetical protein
LPYFPLFWEIKPTFTKIEKLVDPGMKMILSGRPTQIPYTDVIMNIAYSSGGKRRENVDTTWA